MHIFDVDHTLVSGSSGYHYIVTAVREKVVSPSVILSLPIVYLRYRIGKLKPSHLQQELPQLCGIDRKILEDVAMVAYERKLRPALFEEAADFIKALHDSGEEVVLATSSIDIIVEPLAETLDISTIISSSAEFDSENRCTGRFLDAPIFGEQKKQKVFDFLAERNIDPADCAFYSDSVYDLPLLEAVGTPVAVNPDYLLARYAKKAGWEIKRFS
jgi:HAD superfamily hydrolase (TIGR01490 family)